MIRATHNGDDDNNNDKSRAVDRHSEQQYNYAIFLFAKINISYCTAIETRKTAESSLSDGSCFNFFPGNFYLILPKVRHDNFPVAVTCFVVRTILETR